MLTESSFEPVPLVQLVLGDTYWCMPNPVSDPRRILSLGLVVDVNLHRFGEGLGGCRREHCHGDDHNTGRRDPAETEYRTTEHLGALQLLVSPTPYVTARGDGDRLGGSGWQRQPRRFSSRLRPGFRPIAAGQPVAELGVELADQGHLGPPPVGVDPQQFVHVVTRHAEAVGVDGVDRRDRPDRGLDRRRLVGDAVEDPLEHPGVLAVAGPQELAVGDVLAEPAST